MTVNYFIIYNSKIFVKKTKVMAFGEIEYSYCNNIVRTDITLLNLLD